MQKFKVGDKVRRIKRSSWPEDYGNFGEVYTVLSTSEGGGIEVIKDKGTAAFDCFELVEEKPTVDNLKLEVGKAYKSVDGKKAVVSWEDEYGFIVDYEDDLSVWHRHEDGGKSNIVNSNPEFSLVSEWVEEPKGTHKFKVGDRVVGNSNHDIEHRRGDTGIVDRLGYSGGYWVTWDSDSETHACRDDEVTLIKEKPTVDIYNTKKTPWSEMTPEEKGTLLLAHHEGKVIEHHAYGDVWFVTDDDGPKWFGNLAYRVKPSPIAETVEMYSNTGVQFSGCYLDSDKYKITYQTVDGEPDWSTIKGETL